MGCTGVRMRRTCRRCCGCAAMRLERSTTLRACTTIASLRTLSLTSCVDLRRRCGGPRHAATAAGWSNISRRTSPSSADRGAGTRAEILAVEVGEIHATLTLRDLQCRRLGGSVVLVTYQSEVDGLFANRSSIWRLTDAGWQMEFHQGTPTTAR